MMRSLPETSRTFI